MNKKLLITALVLPFMAFSQSKDASKFGQMTVGGPQLLSSQTAGAVDNGTFDSMANAGASKAAPKSSAKRGIISYNFVKVGSTYYDLQTNASIGRRVVLQDDGKVSVAWTTSNDATYANRGTGYNHFNLSSWLSVGNPTNRIESVRLGWPSIGVNNGKEWVMGHDAANGGYVLSNNAAIGSTSWSSGSSVLTENSLRPLWGRVANSGNYFHCIGTYADSSQPGEPRAPKRKGVFAPLTYSRSTDGGATWDIQHSILPGYDSTRITSGGGDEYAIDVRGSVVAIVTGDQLKDVMVWKSTDNGTTFTRIIADSFAYAPYNDKKLMLDTPSVCDGSVEVLIDNNNKVHAFWGVSKVFDDDTTDASYSFFPGTSLLAHWSESTGKVQLIAGGSQFDRDKNGTLDISAGNTAALSGGLVPQTLKNNGISSVARLGNTSLLHSPSAGVDASGNIFVTFSFPLEQDVDANNVNLRDVMMVHSTDGGANWAASQDITQIQGLEEEFACVAKKVNNFVHVIFQVDATAGTNLQNNSTADNNHPAGINDIMYAAIPVAKILDGSIQTLWSLGVEQFDANQEVFVVSQNYPNPFSSNSDVIIWLNTESNVTIEITNVSGQVVSTQDFGSKGAGNHSITMNADGLAAGIYFYTVKTATHSVTKKMTIN